jgi:hypothetical protein
MNKDKPIYPELNLQVGESVWDGVNFPNQKGEVVDIAYTERYPLCVLFSTQRASYNPNGQYQLHSKPTLSRVPYEFEPQKQPERFEMYERVLMRDTDVQNWTPQIYMCETDGTFRYKSGNSMFKQCTKWNPSLIGKTDKV